MNTRTITIVGGGPGGLTLARLLQNQGMRVTDKDGAILFDDQEPKSLPDFDNAYCRPEIDRGLLRDLLIDSLHAAGSGWTLRFKSDLTACADIVVAADGAKSKLRKYVTNIPPLYSGITIVEGAIENAEKNAPALHALLNGGKVFAFGSEKSIIVSTKGDGSLSFYTGTKEAEQWVSQSGIDFANRHSVATWFRRRYGDWSSLWGELFESDESYLIPRPMYHFPLDQHWPTRSNLTLLGHPTWPCWTPWSCLTAWSIRMPATIRRYWPTHYEQQMLSRSSEMTESTLAQTQALHSAGSLPYMLSLFSQRDDLDPIQDEFAQ